MQDPELSKQDQGVPRFMKHYLQRDENSSPSNQGRFTVGGVHTYTCTPRSGISERNKHES